MLLTAGMLLLLIGIAHSVLGERYILIRLFRKNDLPALFGSDWFTKQTLRFAWHITTLCWWGFALVLFVIATKGQISRSELLWVVAGTFGLTSVIALVFSRARHLSWIVFGAISTLCLLAIEV